MYFNFCTHYSVLTTESLAFMCHHTVDPLYPFHPSSLVPSGNHYSVLCMYVFIWFSHLFRFSICFCFFLITVIIIFLLHCLFLWIFSYKLLKDKTHVVSSLIPSQTPEQRPLPRWLIVCRMNTYINEDECRATKQLKPLISAEALLKLAPGQKFSNYFSDSILIKKTASGMQLTFWFTHLFSNNYWMPTGCWKW